MTAGDGTKGRACVAVLAGALAGSWAALNLTRSGEVAADFTWPWRAARALFAGLNPYDLIRATGPYPFDAPLKYPLPAAVVAAPLAWLRGEAAAGVFVAGSVALFAWAVTRSDRALGLENRWPLLLSGCVFFAVRSVQWSPLLAAALLLSPWAVGIGVVKPNLGLAMFAARPGWRAAALAALLVAVALAALPSWPLDWLRVLRAGVEPHYRAPGLGGAEALALGPAVFLVLLRWRRPEARLIAALAALPQVPAYYDQLLVLAVVAKTRREALGLAAATYLGYAYLLVVRPTIADDRAALAVLLTVYAPAVYLVLRRPNVSEAPWH